VENMILKNKDKKYLFGIDDLAFRRMGLFMAGTCIIF